MSCRLLAACADLRLWCCGAVVLYVTDSNAPGVTLNTNVDFGGVGGVQYLDPSVTLTGYWDKMIETLQKSGYTIGVNLHGAPYDWRLAPDGHAAPGQYYDKLKALIESSVTNNGRKAVIVTHSLGG